MNKDVKDILAELQAEQNRDLARREAYEAQVYGAHPILKTLTEERDALMLEALSCVLKTPGEKEAIMGRAREQAEALGAKMAAYREEAGIRPFESALCPLCGGSGRLEKGLCACLKERIYKEVLGGEDVAAARGSFGSFDGGVFPEEGGQRARMMDVKEALLRFAKKFPDNPKKLLLFLGNAGVGKSYALSSLLKEIQKKERDILYISAARLFDYLHKYRLGEAEDVSFIYAARVLAVDDLGSEPMTQNVTREFLFDILMSREKEGLFTFLVTNNSLLQLKERYTERVSSRLMSKESALVVKFTGKDLRLAP